MTDQKPKIGQDDVRQAREKMLSDPAEAYDTLVSLAAKWLATEDIPQRHSCERLAGIMFARYGMDQGWSGIWYHLNGRHRGMDVNTALALLGALETDILQRS